MSYPNQPPGPPPGPPPNQPPGPYQPPFAAAPKKSNAWKWILGTLGVLVLLCGGGLVTCTVLVGQGVNEAVEEDQDRAAANKKSCEGKSYPDQQPDNDRCADAVGSVTIDEVKVVATPLARRQDTLCTDVSYANNSDKTISFNVFDWKLQVPTGEVKDAFDSTDNPNWLGSGDLVKGGTKSGTVCYEAPGSGQFILIYKPSFWSDARGIWVHTI
ncbi:DUF4352 domain-containing protein [Micromonospora sp. CPCC 205371]|nr:DUF4352 domain-containing protein [Micromonospora sp. CPCC 205371]